ncbi:MAG: monovalent cation/H+ antiporter subunit D family protein [Alphaproteobacteria bacterium]
MTALVLLAIGVPLLGAALIVATAERPNLREGVTLVTAGALFGIVAALLPRVMSGARPGVVLGDILPGLGLAFEVEPLGMLFGLVASFLWLMTSIYSIGYMRANKETNQTRFYACFALALASTMGVAFAGNMFTLFVFYEALTISTYPLVTHSGSEEARRSGRIYLGLLLFTSIGFLLFAILWTWVLTGTLDFREGGILANEAPDAVLSILLVLYIFGIGKAAIMPFHRWLPAAMVAPTPVSALLHAVAVVKAGVFTVVKVVVYIFGIDTLDAMTGGDWLIYVAGITIIVASLIALTQDNLKLRLAYSTVSQLSYVVLGAGLANAWGVLGGSLHIATHAFGKITLFFCAGAIYTASKKKNISEMVGIGRAMPYTMTAFLIGSLSLIGLPPLAGIWSKWYLGLGTLASETYLLLAVLLVSSVLNAIYFLPIVVRAFAAPPGAEGASKLKEAPIPCLIALGITATGCVVLFFYLDPFYRLLQPIVAR